MTYNTSTNQFGTLPYGKQPSAKAEIVLNIGPCGEYGFGDYRVWRSADFTAPTEAEVKELVEIWVQKQMNDFVALLGGIGVFATP